MSFLRQAHTAYHVLPASKRNTTRVEHEHAFGGTVPRARKTADHPDWSELSDSYVPRPPQRDKRGAPPRRPFRRKPPCTAHLAPVTATARGTARPSIGPHVPIAPVSVRARHTTSGAHLSAAHWPLAGDSINPVLPSGSVIPPPRTDPFRFRLRRGSARPAGAEEYLGHVPIARATCRARIARRPDNHWTTGHGPDSGHLAGNGNKSGFACLVSQRAGRALGLLLSAIAKATCSHRRTWTRNAARRV